jgi:hypothetical protein
MSLFPKRVTFKMAIWAIGIVMAGAISGWPLLYEAYARHAWQRIPCYKSPDKEKFDFEFNGKFYHCGRLNFWESASVDTTPGVFGRPSNDFCYIDGATPPAAVFHLDAYKHLGDGIGNFAASGMVLVVCAFITLRSRRSASAARSPS